MVPKLHWAARIALVLASIAAAPAFAGEEKPQVYFISPAAGDVLSSPVTIRMGLKGMGIAPAGVDRPHTGHFHLLIDTKAPAAGEVIPSNEHNIHFGGGQTEASVPLSPGRHVLQIVLGTANHAVFDPPIVSDPLTITVK
ncbi:MAG: DUF4399 domain-containing protein [Proteobacteria bacterium]|nr:DUF4399 domain-containing protein [Pseudomonadota bacterium]